MDSDTFPPVPEASRYGLNRAAVLEWLYHLDGRHESTHPYHSLYTGLAEQYRYQLGRIVLESMIRSWHEGEPRGVAICLSEEVA